ncbi:hypothetical protein KOI35_37590 [Actinoplanes bogorensis]|uniref:Collagen triple helix repeat-containing protein n=1 Tax=Paractinoplanes bogorensis TaxID=1610840 RepID=A0ABS5Z151_9ACTN|nr:hypothetical protein [Actinoplanes bogorensis]MBU2669241.1 hypothetical protein [Actinoplanes bogorensis]
MNRISRMLTVTGLGLLAGVTMGAGPAMAATSTDAGASKAGASSQADRRDRVVGYYNSYRACDLAGRIGERFDRWDDYDCERVGFGFHRRYALEVSWDRDWRWFDRDRGHGRPWFNDRHHHNGGKWGDKDGKWGDKGDKWDDKGDKDGKWGDKDGQDGKDGKWGDKDGQDGKDGKWGDKGGQDGKDGKWGDADKGGMKDWGSKGAGERDDKPAV